MCVVSMVMDHYTEKWFRPYQIDFSNPPTRQEFDDLKKDVLEMRELLKRAKIYDEENGQKDCELEEKKEIIRKVAEAVGIDIEEIFAS